MIVLFIVSKVKMGIKRENMQQQTYDNNNNQWTGRVLERV